MITKLRFLPLVMLTLFTGGVAAAQSAQPSDTASEGASETATFAMYCYWTGEATLGRVDGILASRIGHWAGKEIVQVDYDPAQTNVDELVKALRKQRSFDAVVFGSGEGQPSAASPAIEASGEPHFIEPKHSLRTRHPQLWALDLDEAQAIALNSWSYFGGPMPDVLTEEQRRAISSN